MLNIPKYEGNMAIDVDRALASLKSRRTDPESGLVRLREPLRKSLIESWKNTDKVAAYLEGVFEPIEFDYLKKTFEECERVKNQIEKAAKSKSLTLEFENQGSATNGTVIKVVSDIDLLVIHGHFITLDPSLPNSLPYEGDPLTDIKGLRELCSTHLASSFPQAKVDTSGGKSVSIEGGSLARKVDVVPANWHHSVDYVKYNCDRVFRGIRIFDTKKSTFVKNYPFLHNALLGIKDRKTSGKFTGLVRAIKSIKEDAREAGFKVDGISSYNITAIAYSIDDQVYASSTSSVDLLLKFISHSLAIAKDDSTKSSLKVPNETSSVFDANGETEHGLMQIIQCALALVQIALDKTIK